MRTWRVHFLKGSGFVGAMEVRASAMTYDGTGSLIFMLNERIEKMFARGTWALVEDLY
jgi:hypothetical protein